MLGIYEEKIAVVQEFFNQILESVSEELQNKEIHDVEEELFRDWKRKVRARISKLSSLTIRLKTGTISQFSNIWKYPMLTSGKKEIRG